MGGKTGPPEPIAASVDGVTRVIARRELQGSVRDAIAALDEGDRAVVVLRGIERMSNNKVAEILGVQPSASSMRYHTALARLRNALPESVFSELPSQASDR